MSLVNLFLRKRLFFLLPPLFLLFLFIHIEQIAAYPNPPLVVNKSEHDFGVISQESTVRVTFTITNITNKPVPIDKIRSSCGCTLVKSLKDVIAPRESLPLEVSFDPKDKFGISQEDVRITYKDRLYPDLVLTIKSQVSATIIAVPQEVRFEPVSIGGQIRPKTIRIIQTNANPTRSLEILYSTSTLGYFDVEVKDDPFGNRFEKQVKIIPRQNLAIGVIRDVLSFKTNHPRMKKIDIPVSVEIVGNITIRPEVLLFGFCQPLKISTKTITIRSNSEGKPIHILKTSTDLPQLQIKMELDRTKKNMYRLIAELKPRKKDDSITGTIDVFTTDPYQQHIKIPVIANVAH